MLFGTFARNWRVRDGACESYEILLAVPSSFSETNPLYLRLPLVKDETLQQCYLFKATVCYYFIIVIILFFFKSIKGKSSTHQHLMKFF